MDIEHTASKAFMNVFCVYGSFFIGCAGVSEGQPDSEDANAGVAFRHQLMMGEGGGSIRRIRSCTRRTASYATGGRECIYAEGQDNLCGHRFDGQFGTLPRGYDHKYVYSRLGYNLKVADMQAAVGCAQLKNLLGVWRKGGCTGSTCARNFRMPVSGKH